MTDSSKTQHFIAIENGKVQIIALLHDEIVKYKYKYITRMCPKTRSILMGTGKPKSFQPAVACRETVRELQGLTGKFNSRPQD